MSRIFCVAAAAGVLAAGFAMSSAQAAPVPTSVAKIKGAVSDNIVTVQGRRFGGYGWRGPSWRGGYGWRGYGWRGYGWRYPYYGYGYGWGWPYYGAGVVVGAVAAAPYYYAPPVYAPPPAATRSGAARQCWVDTDSSRGYGFWQPC